MVQLNNRKLLVSVIGTLGVISGVILKNSFEQLKQPDHPLAKGLGPILFMGGWAIVAYALSFNPNKGYLNIPPMNLKTIVSFAAAGAIVAAVMMMKRLMAEGKPMTGTNMIFPALFVAGWFALGYALGNDVMSYAVPVMVIVSMMVILPQQRKKCVVDGPGMPLFVAAWALLAFKNSLVSF